MYACKVYLRHTRFGGSVLYSTLTIPLRLLSPINLVVTTPFDPNTLSYQLVLHSW